MILEKLKDVFINTIEMRDLCICELDQMTLKISIMQRCSRIFLLYSIYLIFLLLS